MAKREQQSPSGLPAGVAAAWGLKERPGKGPARALDVRRIVTAAIGVADAEGLAAVSMSRVATEVGVSTMALYRYVAGKDDLLILMEDAAIGSPSPGPPAGEGLRAGLAHWAGAYRDVLRDHLWIVRIPIGTPPLSPHNVEWMEQALAYLRGTGLNAEEKLGVLITVSGYVRSNVSLLADIDEATRAAATTWEGVERSYWGLLTELTSAGDFPAIRELLASGELSDSAESADSEGTADFEFGLGLILDGVEALTASRR
ncbi:TetR/AcrR family transcriptional regulator [Streptomyces spirodelae]|uniref:TetR/AcrR family transcriptional regulator C-terminal domain-containing protein n=1 Tax=Streptomyces spirodelae TaxID=2812904 RepID=A0ABS3WN11_9ACTN|nr:TetR/AcrR family transcriptional regulator [Streptomyces spirodelae]MBO8184404.1 TetR/AcrR family transcriptional regulator C-terminal domain-containing protein [Streptomyces spirodelae]